MLRRKMKRKNEEKGITLIALVVTMIVLLILAGVAIAALSGDNGILTRAADSKQKTEIADIKEELQRKILEEQIVNEGNITSTALETILTSKGVLSDETDILDRTLTTTKENYNIPVRDIWNGTLSDNKTINFTVEGVAYSTIKGTKWSEFLSTQECQGLGMDSKYDYVGRDIVFLGGAVGEEGYFLNFNEQLVSSWDEIKEGSYFIKYDIAVMRW